MTTRLFSILAAVAAATVPASVLQAQTAGGTAFTYQGRLTDGCTPADGEYDFLFLLYDAYPGGSQVGPTLEFMGEPVSVGLFTVKLDFGDVFDGTPLWLEVWVRRDSSEEFTPLYPRQELTPAPYAVYASNGGEQGLACWDLDGDGVEDPEEDINEDGVWDAYDCQGTGEFWSLTGNAGTDPNTHFLGTTDDAALELHVNNACALRIEPDPTSPNVIGGYGGNSAPGVFGATVGGGGVSGSVNQVTANCGTVGGGRGNTASGENSTIGGGTNNTASYISATVGGDTNTAGGQEATIGGGYDNETTSDCQVIAGGCGNKTGGGQDGDGGYGAAIGGGSNNSAEGAYSVIPGGLGNIASGSYSFAAGYRALALHDGTFVFADDTDAEIASSGPGQFIVRASGGIWLGAAREDCAVEMTTGHFITTSTGAGLTAGGTWANASDVALKENFAPVNGREVLARLAAMPIATWNYRAEGPDVRHLGPTSQDFSAAFSLGGDDKHITTADADGVALAAIQELHKIFKEKDVQIAAQQDEISALRARLEKIETLVTELATTEIGGAR